MNSRFVVSAPNKAARALLYPNQRSNWSLLKLRSLSTTNCVSQQQAQKEPTQEPVKPSGSSGGKIFAFALTGFTLGLGYAYLNPDSRRQITYNVPQVDYLFSFIDGVLGRKKPSEQPIQMPVDQPKLVKKSELPKPLFPSETTEKVEPVKVKAEAKKKQEVPKEEAPKLVEVKVEEPVTKKEVVAPVVVEEAPAVVEEKTTKPVAEEEEKNMDWRDTVEKFELQREASIQAFEAKLRNVERSAKQNVSDTMEAAREAVAMLNKYKDSLIQALDEKKSEDKESQWKQVTDMFEAQSQVVNSAKKKIQESGKSLDELEALIKDAKQNEHFKNLKSLRASLKELVEQQRTVMLEDKKLKEALIHANVLRSYTKEQKAARSQFLKEIQALQPEGIQAKAGSEMSQEQTNNLLIHAHRRVVQLQSQLEKMQASQNQQIQSALEDQRKQFEALQEENNEMLRQLSRQEFGVEKDKLLEAEELKRREAVRQELAKQAAAHNNHLAQMLKLQHEELGAFYERKLSAENQRIRGEFFAKVAETLGKINGIENAMKARVNLELQANNASQLWLAVQNLSEIISVSAADSGNELAQIKANLETIKNSAPDNEFVQKLVSSVPQAALEGGVWTEPDLKERFKQVKRVCRRTALIDERGGTLFKYFLSYVQSFFIVDTAIDHAKLEAEGSPSLEKFDMSTFNILSYAEYYVESGQFDLAVKLLRQLKGEPSRLAKGWVNDATQLLEIRQACHLLTAYISSIYIGTRLK